MSYYIGVFDGALVPDTRSAFVNWFKKKSEWNDDRDYDSLTGCSEKLCAFFMDIKQVFQPLNGEYAPDYDNIDEDTESKLIDYCICEELIYMSSGWSVADEFSVNVKEKAQKYGLGTLEFTSEGYLITKADGNIME